MIEQRAEKERRKRKGREEGKKVSKKGMLLCEKNVSLNVEGRLELEMTICNPGIINSDSGKDHQYAKTVG